MAVNDEFSKAGKSIAAAIGGFDAKAEVIRDTLRKELEAEFKTYSHADQKFHPNQQEMAAIRNESTRRKTEIDSIVANTLASDNALSTADLAKSPKEFDTHLEKELNRAVAGKPSRTHVERIQAQSLPDALEKSGALKG